MEIPTEWYVHILPGVVILASLIPLNKLDALEIPPKLRDLNLLGSTVLLGLAGYLTGFAGNAIALEILKPLLNWVHLLDKPQSPKPEEWILLYQLGKFDIIKICQESYQGMILNRSLFGGFFLFTVASVIGYFWRKDKKKIRIALLILSILTTFSLHQYWLNHRDSHYSFINAVTSPTTSVQNNGTQQKENSK